MSTEEAIAKLQAELAPAVDAPISVSAGERSITLTPADSGLTVDYEATVAAAGGGYSWNPVEIFESLTGGGPVDLVRVVDRGTLTTVLGDNATTFAVDGVPATVAFDGEKVVRTPAAKAEELNIDETADDVSSAFAEGKGNVEATLDESDPAVTDAMVDEVIATFAAPLVSGPVTLTHNDTSMEISPPPWPGRPRSSRRAGRSSGSSTRTSCSSRRPRLRSR
ncbi:hypothetical protein G7085_15565 [Tessaracoccus sp. HDW20]|uniref:peptidoglycan binding domain-containing protein n=1 Tax=Tessaracoccus coleopterorum TaxID=2714950 RepID=UPI0018D34502|nr:peptidoglycan binding domain-containing protein [Tessaracoccus coleopterorum]NHB85545.1 hypothetical protein [Tessaracoccus coleopterorum]